ncbi:hypothetical protein [Amycolatopsis sp. lyj-108]|uniref:hypothetical protein n=1 Tax=Amycolatopsis sp. lyj-108 TaxID=2789286 RepID=UPI003979C2C0
MTIRLHGAWSDAGRNRHLHLQAITRAISLLLKTDPDRTAWPAGIGSGRVAVVRGPDRESRQVRDAVRAAVTQTQGALLDLPSVPDFGRIPVAGDIRFVVAGHASLFAAARRCAAFWRCGVLTPATAAAIAITETFALRSTPAAAISTSYDWYDHCARNWTLKGDLSLRTTTGEWTRATDVVLRPSPAGLLVTTPYGETLQEGIEPLAIRAEQAVSGTIDGHEQVFPGGEYTCVFQDARVHQFLGPVEQGPAL